MIYFTVTDYHQSLSQKLTADLWLPQDKLVLFKDLEGQYLSDNQNTIAGSLPTSLKERVIYWFYFGEGILESP